MACLYQFAKTLLGWCSKTVFILTVILKRTPFLLVHSRFRRKDSLQCTSPLSVTWLGNCYFFLERERGSLFFPQFFLSLMIACDLKPEKGVTLLISDLSRNSACLLTQITQLRGWPPMSLDMVMSFQRNKALYQYIIISWPGIQHTEFFFTFCGI